jgi:hypothetical protein
MKNQPAMVQLVDGGLAVDVFLGSDLMKHIRSWRFGAQAELNLANGEEPSVSIRPAREGEPALKLQYSPAGPFFRVPTPDRVTIISERLLY